MRTNPPRRNPLGRTTPARASTLLAAVAALLAAGVAGVAGCAPRATTPPATAAPAAASGTSAGTRGDTAALRREIAAMMARSAAAWNRGDLDAFMEDYLPGDRTTFVTPRAVVHGRDVIRARYAPRFAPGASRDSLHFEGLEVDPLGPGVLHAVAFYVLVRGDSVTAKGPTSLVMVRDGGRWRIVHDHSS